MTDAIASDLLILGAGCAGLSLARELAAQGFTGRVDLLEPRSRYTDDRSWCFWAGEHHPLAGLVSASWPMWSISRVGGAPRLSEVRGVSYQYIRSLDFYRTSVSAIASCSTMHLHLDEGAAELEEFDGQCSVVSSAGRRFVAPWVIDTRPPADGGGALLYQCFAGTELLVSGGHGYPLGEAALMHNLQTLDQGVTFDYLLPLDEKRVLVEATCFDPSVVSRAALELRLQQLIASHGWSSAAVVRQEYGVLPMGQQLSALAVGNRVIRAGIAGGALRAASGYGFQRIQAWARDCAASLACGAAPVTFREKPITRWMDRLFLQVLRAKPALAPALYETLFTRASPRAVVNFLSDQASWCDRLAIISSLPARPFLTALVKHSPGLKAAPRHV